MLNRILLVVLSFLFSDLALAVEVNPDVGGVPTYASEATLPVSAQDGATAVTLDAHSFWIYNIGTLDWVEQAGGGGGGSGDVTGVASSVNSEIVLFNGTGGKTIKRATGTGFVKVVSGVMQTPAATIGSSEIADGSIVDADVNSSAAIATSKISGPVTSISGHGLGGLATLDAVGSSEITDGAIVNADVNASAAIATSKLSGAVTSISGHGLGSLATASAVSGGTGGTITDDTITDADINSAAAIVDTKLATIATAGKVSDTALSSNVTKLGSDISLTAEVSGVLPIANGGTSAITPSAARAALDAQQTLVVADSTHDGYLASADWTTFNNKQPAGSYVTTARQVLTTSPLTGGGALSADLTLAMPAATSIADGYLTLGDWSTFNGKQNAIAPVDQTAWVSLSGDDGLGQVGDITLPFATIAAAEAAITDATDTVRYVINIAPGEYDVTGMEKKSDIFWQGSGAFATRIITTTGPLLLANASMATDNTYQGFSDLGIDCSLEGDFQSLGGVGSTFWSFYNVVTTAPIAMIGRGGDRDSVFGFSTDFDDGWDLTSINASTTAVRFAGQVNVKCDNGNGGQWLTAGATVLSQVVVQDVDNASFCLIGLLGSIVGGQLTIDGANAQAYVDAGAVVGDNIIQLNGGVLNLVTHGNRVAYTPADSSQWSVVPGQVAAALDAVAGGTVRPISWSVLGPINGTTSTTDAATVAVVANATAAVTADGDITTVGLNASATGTVTSGATNDKAIAAGVFTATRGNSSDDGTAHEVDGAQALVFHQGGAASITDKGIGFGVTHFLSSGTVTNLYDFYSITLPMGGTATNHYGLFVDDAGSPAANSWGIYDKGSQYNWLKNSLKIGGSAGSTDRVADSSYNLEVTGKVYVSDTNAVTGSRKQGMEVLNTPDVGASARSLSVYSTGLELNGLFGDGTGGTFSDAQYLNAGLYVEAVPGSAAPAAVINQELSSTGPLLRLVNGQNFDYVMVDINLPGRTGVGNGIYSLTLPEDQGAAGTTMTNDGSGILSWTAFPSVVAAPAASTDACTTGQVASDTGFWYVCIATNTWKRSVLITW